jgi:hypothetical protein
MLSSRPFSSSAGAELEERTSVSTRPSRRVRSRRAPLVTGHEAKCGLCGPSCKHDDCSSRLPFAPPSNLAAGARLPGLLCTEAEKGSRGIREAARPRGRASSGDTRETVDGYSLRTAGHSEE